MPTVAVPTRAGYRFEGYYDAQTSGVKYYDADGTSARAWNKTANATLYARWAQAEFTLTVTASPAAGGSVTGGGTRLSGSQTVTATAADSYGFAGWQENGVNVSSDAEYTFELTADRALTAIFLYTGVRPPASSNGISGVTAGQTFTRGAVVRFTAIGGGASSASPIASDMRWLPTSWATNPSGNFATGFTQSFSTSGMTLGAHTHTVTFTQQLYDGASWANTGETDTKSVSFTLVEPDIPDTGDDSAPWLWISLMALAGLGAVALSLANRGSRAK